MQDNNDVIEIDLQDLFGLLLSKIWLITLSTIGMGLLAFIISAVIITPKYESSTSIYILNKDTGNTLTYSDAQLASQLTKDYENLVKARTVLEQVIDEFGIVDEDYEDFADRVEVDNPTDTRIITITVKDEDPRQAQALADRIRDVAALHIRSVTDVEAVNLADYANLPVEPAEPSIPIWTAVGALIGMVLCMLIVIMRHIMDDTIKTADDVEKHMGLSTLALIPDIEIEDAGSTKKKSRKEKDDQAHDVA